MAKIIVKKLSYRAVNPTMVGGTKLFFHSDKVKQAFDHIPRRKFKLAVKANCDSLNQELCITFYKGNNKVLKCSYPYGSHTFTVG